MGCGCATRAGSLLRWLGFRSEADRRWILPTRLGMVTLEIDGEIHHFRLAVAALITRMIFGKREDGPV